MPCGPVKRIRRTRQDKAVPKVLDFDYDDELPPWGGYENVRLTVTLNKFASHQEIADMADAFSLRLYPLKTDPVWPRDFQSGAHELGEDRRCAVRIAWALTQAITAHLTAELSGLQLKIMLYILNRTWVWKKPREGIPYSHFLEGVISKGECFHSPIAKSSGHLHAALKELEKMGLIRISDARTDYEDIKAYEIHVRNVLSRAESIKRKTKDARTKNSQWKAKRKI